MKYILMIKKRKVKKRNSMNFNIESLRNCFETAKKYET